MHDVILWIRDTSIPMAIIACGLAALILAIVAEIPPREHEPPLLRPRKAVPIIGTLLLLIGVPLAIQWPPDAVLLRTILSNVP